MLDGRSTERDSSDCRVIAIDLPGLGDSEPSPSGYEKASIAQALHMLLSTLGHQNISLVGHDIGAAVAYAYAQQFPEEVEKLVLMDDPQNCFAVTAAAQGHSNAQIARELTINVDTARL